MGKPLGKRLLFLLVGINLAWLIYDAYIWIIGKQTLSQWIYLNSEKSFSFLLYTLGVALIIPFVLVWHWELIPLLFKHLRNNDKNNNSNPSN